MTKRHQPAVGLLQRLSLALLIALAVGASLAGAAQAESVWQIDAEDFIGEEDVSISGGPFTLTHDTGVTITCQGGSAPMIISDGDQVSAELFLLGCSVKNAPLCTVPNTTLSLEGQLSSVHGHNYVKFYLDGKWAITGSQCALSGEYEAEGSIAAEIGPAATHPSLTFSSQAETATGATGIYGVWSTSRWRFSGQAQATIQGLENWGHALGVDSFGNGSETLSWYLAGKPFAGEAYALILGGPVVVESAGSELATTITCDSTEGNFTIHDGDQASGELNLESCSAESEVGCEFIGAGLPAEGQLIEAGGDTYLKLKVGGGSWPMWGAECPYEVEGEVYAELWAKIGAEATKLPLSLSAPYFFAGGEEWNVSGQPTMRVSGQMVWAGPV
jgi:hypothetical protein